jgi:hypothetical protein
MHKGLKRLAMAGPQRPIRQPAFPPHMDRFWTCGGQVHTTKPPPHV